MDHKKQIYNLSENDIIKIFDSEIKKIDIDFYFLEHSNHFFIQLFFEKLLKLPKKYRLKNTAIGVYEKHIEIKKSPSHRNSSDKQSADLKELLYDKPLCNLKTFLLKSSQSTKKFFIGYGMYTKLLINNRGEPFSFNEDLFIKNFKFLTQQDKIIFARDLKEYFLNN